MPNPVDPNKPPSAPPPGKPNEGPKQKMQIPEGFKHFLGMDFNEEQSAKLLNSMLQSFNSEIQREKEKSIKAIKNFGKSPGDPGYED